MTEAVETVNEAYRSRYVQGAADDAVAEFGRITLVWGGGNHPIFNVGYVFEPPTTENFSATIDWIQKREAPFWLNVADSALPRIEELAGDQPISKHDMVLSGMIRPSLEDLPPNESDAEVTEVTTDEEAAAFRRVFLTVFDIEEADLPEQSSGDSSDDDRHRFLGRLNDEAVAISGAARIEGVANVFGMGVIEEYRGRGIGTGICSASLRAARKHGCESATLESTPMAVSMYENMGFETVVRYHLFDVESGE